jgi:hypothetical protein
METSVVRQHVLQTIDRAKRAAAERRTAIDAAAKDYSVLLDEVAVPLFRQLAGVLKASGYAFTVNTPSGSVRLLSETTPEDYIELSLDTSGDEPHAMIHTRRWRGRRVLESERPIGKGLISTVTEELLLEILLKEIEPFVEK